MLRVLTDGKVKIGAYKFSDRKKPCLCIDRIEEVVFPDYFCGDGKWRVG